MSVVFPSAPCRTAELRQWPSSGPDQSGQQRVCNGVQRVVQRRAETCAICSWMPRRGPSGILATAPDTESPDAATRHEPPDEPRSGTELSDASPSGAERPGVGRSEAFSSPEQAPRRTPCPCASAAQSRPTALPCNAALGFRQKQACRVFADRAVLRDSRNVFLRRSGQLPHLVQRRSDRPTGKEKRRDSLSLTKRWPEAEGDEQCGKCPPPRAAAAQHRRFPRASGTSSSARTHKTHGASAESSTSPFQRPFQRLAPERPGNTFTPRRHWGTTAPAPRIVKKYSCV